jgi:hypothetical protein
MGSERRHERRQLVEYDALRRRLWILGQRCHHGAAGGFVAGAACVGLLGMRQSARSFVALMVTGGALMVHDWKDHSIWFERGYGTQP